MLYMFKAIKTRPNGTIDIQQPATAAYFEVTKFPANFLNNGRPPEIELRLLNDIVDPITGENIVDERIIRIPEDADTVYVMNSNGDTIDTYRVDTDAPKYNKPKPLPLGKPKQSPRIYPPPPHTHSHTLHPTNKDKR